MGGKTETGVSSYCRITEDWVRKGRAAKGECGGADEQGRNSGFRERHELRSIAEHPKKDLREPKKSKDKERLECLLES